MPGIVSNDNRKTHTGYCTFSHYHNSNFNVHTIVSIWAMSLALRAVEAERVNPGPVSCDSICTAGVGLFLGGLAAGVIGVLLIEGIVCGACRLRRSKYT